MHQKIFRAQPCARENQAAKELQKWSNYMTAAYIWSGGNKIVEEKDVAKVQELTGQAANKAEAKKGTIAYSILSAHNVSDNMDKLRIKFDAMTSQ